jgi:hypothetical protein
MIDSVLSPRPFTVIVLASAFCACTRNVVETQSEPVASLQWDPKALRAVGLPIAVTASFHAICGSSGDSYSLNILSTNNQPDSQAPGWESSSESRTCNEQDYKLDVTCSNACEVVSGHGSNDSGKYTIVSLYPKNPPVMWWCELLMQ